MKNYFIKDSLDLFLQAFFTSVYDKYNIYSTINLHVYKLSDHDCMLIQKYFVVSNLVIDIERLANSIIILFVFFIMIIKYF